jgi:glycosyltransferase involved in cell wall biosynthesis
MVGVHLVLLHGYLLQGTGSNVYVSNVAKAWCAQGHAVTVICQDRDAGGLHFVDEFVGPNDPVPEKATGSSRVRVIVPAINDLLPVYVMDRYDGFDVKTIPEMTAGEIDTHIGMTAAALRAVVAQGVDRVLANHVMMGPVIAKRALEGTDVPYDVKIHGSAIEYTLVPNPRLMPLAVEGLGSAQKIFVGSEHVRDRVWAVFDSEPALRLRDRTRVVPPGMDPDLFRREPDFAASQTRFLNAVRQMIFNNGLGRRAHTVPTASGAELEDYHRALVALGETYDQRAVDSDLLDRWPQARSDEPIVLYFGKFLAAKGVGELMLAVPAILDRVPQARIVFVGFGSYREHLEGMVQGLATGDLDQVAACAGAGEFAQETDLDRWFRPITSDEARRVTITGILNHAALSELLPMASVSVVPSKWPEAFGMVAVEAMAAGVLPLCNYHAGLRSVVDEVARTMPDVSQLMKLDRESFAAHLPVKVEEALGYLYPEGFDRHRHRREVGRRLREFSVSHFSWEGIAQRLLG